MPLSFNGRSLQVIIGSKLSSILVQVSSPFLVQLNCFKKRLEITSSKALEKENKSELTNYINSFHCTAFTSVLVRVTASRTIFNTISVYSNFGDGNSWGAKYTRAREMFRVRVYISLETPKLLTTYISGMTTWIK